MIRADNFYFPWFKLKGKGLCEQWEVFLYGDKTIKVVRVFSVVLLRCVPPPGICGVGFGSSPHLATVTPSMSYACLLRVAWELA